MDIHTDYYENPNKGKSCECFCATCRNETIHTIIFDYQVNSNEFDYDLSSQNDYQIIRCNGCNTVSFRIDGWFSEYQDSINDGKFEELYPEMKKDIRNIKTFNKLPDFLSKLYEEVIHSYNNKNRLLCAVGIRAIIEGICIDKEIKPNTEQENKIVINTLNKKLPALFDAGFISQNYIDVLHELRLLGNDAAHSFIFPSENNIQLALDVVEDTLFSIYEIPEKKEQLIKEKENRRKKR